MDRNRASQVIGRLAQDYGDKAFQFAYRLTGNIDESKDLVQETFYRVVKNWEKYDPDQPLENWFCTILRHIFLDGAKRYERNHLVSLDAPVSGEPDEASFTEILPDGEEALLAALERKESVQAVRRALERLGYEHKTVVTLCDLEGMPYEKIAQVLGCPVGTVRSRVNRARGALRKLLLEEEGVRQ